MWSVSSQSLVLCVFYLPCSYFDVGILDFQLCSFDNELELNNLREMVQQLLRWAWKYNRNLEEQAAQLHMLTSWSQIVEVLISFQRKYFFCFFSHPLWSFYILSCQLNWHCLFHIYHLNWQCILIKSFYVTTLILGSLNANGITHNFIICGIVLENT